MWLVPWHRRIGFGFAVYFLVALSVFAWKPVFTNASRSIQGIGDPALAIQVVRNVDEVDAVLADSPSPDREVMRIKQYVDFGLIVGYVGLTSVIALAVGRRSRFAAFGLIASIVIAGFFDARENLTILRLVNIPLTEVTPGILQSVGRNSLVKWVFMAVSAGLLGVMLLRAPRTKQGRKYLGTAIHLAASIAGPVELLASILILIGLRYHPVLIWAGVTSALGLLLSAATLKVLPYESAA